MSPLGVAMLVFLSFPARAVTLTRVASTVAPTPGARVEFRAIDVPPTANPFDPDLVAIDALLSRPTGDLRRVPGFWFRDYQRALVDGQEQLTPVGSGEWRLRVTATEPGLHHLSVTVRTNGVPAGPPAEADFEAVSSGPARSGGGFVGLAADRRSFATDRGENLPLVGHCVCWHHERGTYDYDDWLPPMAQAGENYTRLWMAPWAFGLEAEPDTRLNYRLDRAWQLDRVLDQSADLGINVLLCLDFHGMFETQPDYWGGNNYWPKHPYNQAKGGPCARQDDFFTDAAAQRLYQKRLRYLIARYGWNPHLLGWEFFNEIDNVYQYLNPAHVAAWHATMGGWLKANDPWNHLVTTSLTGSSDRSDLWSLAVLDFSAFHSYGQTEPVTRLPVIVKSFLDRYRKPMMIGEFGTDWRGWKREQDPYLRGWRQGIWTGALSGSVGTSMSWWWEDIQSARLHATYRVLRDILEPAGWGTGVWTNLVFASAGDPPINVGNPLGGAPFTATLPLSQTWGTHSRGQLALPDPAAAGYAPSFLNSFVHGTAHADLRTPFQINTWTTNGARLVLHLNSVSDGAILVVRRNGIEILRRPLPNKDGAWLVNEEYNEDIAVALPDGRQSLEIANGGGDWFNLDWVRIENAVPAIYAPAWTPSAVAVGLQRGSTLLTYVVNPLIHFPTGATNPVAAPCPAGQLLIQSVSPAGRYRAQWFDAATGTNRVETVGTSDGQQLRLQLPEFTEDLAGRIEWQREITLVPQGLNLAGAFSGLMQGGPEGPYRVETSANLQRWEPLTTITNLAGSAPWRDASARDFAQRFYRVQGEGPR